MSSTTDRPRQARRLPGRARGLCQPRRARGLAACPGRAASRPSKRRSMRCASGETDLAIIPVENSVYGRIADVHFLVRQFGRAIKGYAEDGQNNLFILGEHFHRVRHQLLGLKGAKLDGREDGLQPGPGARPMPQDHQGAESRRQAMVGHRGRGAPHRRTEGSERGGHRLVAGGRDLRSRRAARRRRRRTAQHDALSHRRRRAGRCAQ